jgi:two-component system OmpR family sensor kinase
VARTDVASQQFDMVVRDGTIEPERIEAAPDTDYFVVVYDPADPYEPLAVAGGRGAAEPDFPASFPLDLALARELQVFTLTSPDGEAEYRATVTVQETVSGGILYTQLVAAPLAGVNRTIGTYLGIYSIIAVITIVVGALATRLLVTLAFRSLAQVETTAMSIASGDFSTRMTDIAPGTEVGRLKSAINAMLGRVDAAISQRDATVQQMRRFIGDASHELRTPLVTVRGYAELYRMGAITSDEDVAQSMERIEKEAIRMGLLVEDLLSLARLDERRDVVIAPVDLRPIARDAALDVRATSPQRAVTVIDTTAGPLLPDLPQRLMLDDGTPRKRSGPPTSAIARASVTLAMLRRRQRNGAPGAAGSGAPATPPIDPPSGVAADFSTDPVEPIVLGDENRIRQVVTNLLGNARRFTAEDSPVELRVGVDRARSTGWIEIVDHGEGVPDQIKEKIFQRFWRADNSRTRETGGSGLGLSIVASIVEALHGTVSVSDTPGGGATFRVALPLVDRQDAEAHRHLETQPLRSVTSDQE